MIALSMNRTDYENDIRSLLMAFFYGEKIVLNGEEECLPGCSVYRKSYRFGIKRS